MNCQEITERMELYVLGVLEADVEERVRGHIDNCPQCREIERQYRLIVRQLKDSGGAGVCKGDFTEKVIILAADEIEGAKSRPAWRFSIRAASIAACLLIVLSVGVLFLGRGGQSDIGAVSVQNPDVRHINAGARAVPLSVADDIVLCGESIYYLLEDGLKSTVAAVDSRTGSPLWRSVVESQGLITADESYVYCVAPAREGKTSLVAIDQRDGRVAWSFSQPKQKNLEAAYMPIVLSRQKLCWVINSTIYVLNCVDGEVLWSSLVDEESFVSEPAICGNSLYAAGADGLYCFDISTGQKSLVFTYDCQPSRWVRPLLAANENRICLWQRLQNGQSRLLCLERQSGKTLWTQALPRTFHLHIEGGKIYARSQENVVALDLGTGSKLWDFRAAGCGPVTCAAGHVFFVDMSGSGRLVALDGKTGSKVLDLASMPSCNKFVKAGETGYLKTHDGVIHIIPFKS